MEKIEFIDYERIQEAYKNFVHTLVWESRDLFEGLHEDAVNKYIERFAEANTDKAIEDTYNALCEVSTTRYDVYKHECNEQYDFVEEYVFHTDNLTEAMMFLILLVSWYLLLNVINWNRFRNLLISIARYIFLLYIILLSLITTQWEMWLKCSKC